MPNGAELRRGLWLEVDIAAQLLRLRAEEELLREYSISTAANGPGEQEGSNCTPRGWHTIRAKIGAGQPPGAVFRGRRPTGEIYDARLGAEQPGRDWILSRILWLSGLEPGRNRLGAVDSMRRYIYIHGCPDPYPMGVARSAGCVRMRNAEVIELYDRVAAGTPVYLHE